MKQERIPVWKSILSSLKEDIQEARYKPGDKLPTEAELSRRFGVNRHTVRRAISELAENGTVFPRRGSGVFVTQVPTDYALGRRVRFHSNLKTAGRLPKRKALLIETRKADAREADALGLQKGASVHSYDGLSFADDQPIAIFRSVFCACKLPSLPEILRRHASITESLRDLGVSDYTRAWTKMTARLANPTRALHLQIKHGAALICTESLNIDLSGEPLEYGRTWFCGERVTLTLDSENPS